MISVVNVSKTYGQKDDLKVEALKNATFHVEKGEFVCIIGTSGSGKSTLLHLMAGVDRVSEGRIVVNGKDITEMNQDELADYRRCDVGIVYQFFNLVPVLTAKENIELPMMLGGEKVDEKYFNEICDMLEIQHRLNFYPSKLSGGEQQRVAIARALIHRPSIILADEPTGNLNSQLAKEIMEFLVMASRKLNQTIIMITHDMNLAKYADRIIEIQDGRLVSDNKKGVQKVKKQEELKEGLDEQTGYFVIHYEAFIQCLEEMASRDQESMTLGSMSKTLVRYCRLLKESLNVLEKNHYLIFLSSTSKKAEVLIKTIEDLIKYIETYPHLKDERKKQIIHHILEE